MFQIHRTVKSGVLLFGMLMTLSAQAFVEKELVVVTSDIDKDVAKLVYVMDDDSRELIHLYQDNYKNNKRVERIEIDPSEVNGRGIVLHKKDKYVTVRLYSHNFDVQHGGVLYLDTLYSGISGERREYEIEVTMQDGVTTMLHKKQAFGKMHFKAKKAPIVGAIGIEKVTFSK